MPSQKLTLEHLVHQRLKAWDGSSHRIIKFPSFFSKVCPIYCLTKDQAWQVIRSMEEMGMLEVIPFHGIRVKG